jgi:hypothetical protein
MASRENLGTLLGALEAWRDNLPIVRLALVVLVAILDSSRSAAAAAAGSASFMGRLGGIRAGHRAKFVRLRESLTAGNVAARRVEEVRREREARVAREREGGAPPLCAEGVAEEERVLRGLQRKALSAVGMEAGSEGFSLSSTMGVWEHLFKNTLGPAAAAAARAAAGASPQKGAAAGGRR